MYFISQMMQEDFTKWYEGNFKAYIERREDAPSGEELVQQLTDLL